MAGCGGADLPATGEVRASGQSQLMGKTLAGSSRCDPKHHDRPFVVEWDATDMSSFQSQAANDVVFVRYEGCDLKVIDSCRLDDQHGVYGAYKPVEWTSGQLEKIDIKDEGELFAKLPLGAASLGGRVQAGEQFHMEYFVSGTRTATRPQSYRGELGKNPGCKGVTHFVYAYNLGAFALGSRSEIKGEVGATVWGIGAGAGRESSQSAEKKGGDIGSCTGESAKEVETCKVPIRLTLREVSEGDDPDAAAASPGAPDAANLAGKVDAKIEMDDKSRAHYDAALERLRARDGKGCVAALDKRDQSDRNAEILSTNPRSPIALLRAQCVMLAGQCDAGKEQVRKAWQAQHPAEGPERTDNVVSAMAGQYCQGGSMSPRDQLLAASNEIQNGSMTKTDPAKCTKAWATLKLLARTVKPKDEDDAVLKGATTMPMKATQVAMCLGRAGDCKAAFAVYREGQEIQFKDSYDNPKTLAEVLKPERLRPTFDNLVPHCKGK
jgi:hypothetical protein